MLFNRMEFAGSLGDLGTLLPITLGMVMVNGMSAVGTFFTIGLFYIIAGLYFRVPIAIQPMKAIGAYAIGTAMTAQQVSGATLLVSLFLFVIGITGTISWIGKMIPKAVIRGVQLSTGILLMNQGLMLTLGLSKGQQTAGLHEPFFSVQQIGIVPIWTGIGIAGLLLTLLLLNNKKFPAAIAVVAFGLLCGMFLGDHASFSTFSPGFYTPDLFPVGLPAYTDLTIALFVLVLPQIPMTVGNAAVAGTDLSREYFGDQAERVTYRSMTLSMAFGSALGFLLGSIPLCHGAGGLAAHYRFGARTGGSNLMIGTIFILMAIFFGPHTISILQLLPFSILGVLLLFSGAQLGLTVLDMMNRQHMFIILVMLTITLTVNLAAAFISGLVLAALLRSPRFEI